MRGGGGGECGEALAAFPGDDAALAVVVVELVAAEKGDDDGEAEVAGRVHGGVVEREVVGAARGLDAVPVDAAPDNAEAHGADELERPGVEGVVLELHAARLGNAGLGELVGRGGEHGRRHKKGRGNGSLHVDTVSFAGDGTRKLGLTLLFFSTMSDSHP